MAAAEAASTNGTGDGAASFGEDDLTLIVGIGPGYAAQLRAAGIVTYAGLAASTPDGLAAAIDVPEWRRPDFQLWIDQAKSLPERA